MLSRGDSFCWARPMRSASSGASRSRPWACWRFGFSGTIRNTKFPSTFASAVKRSRSAWGRQPGFDGHRDRQSVFEAVRHHLRRQLHDRVFLLFHDFRAHQRAKHKHVKEAVARRIQPAPAARGRRRSRCTRVRDASWWRSGIQQICSICGALCRRRIYGAMTLS